MRRTTRTFASLGIGGCGGGHGASAGVNGRAETVFETVPDSPFGVVTTPDGRYAVVDLVGGRVLVYSVAKFVPRLIATIHVPTRARLRRLPLRHGSRQRVQTGSLAAVQPDGTLSVISVDAAEHDPAHAVLATVPALSEPVRGAVSPDGAVVWVTARASDRLLAFLSAKLLTDPTRALLTGVKVGAAPVGPRSVALFDNGDRVIVADSNRFNAPGTRRAHRRRRSRRAGPPPRGDRHRALRTRAVVAASPAVAPGGRLLRRRRRRQVCARRAEQSTRQLPGLRALADGDSDSPALAALNYADPKARVRGQRQSDEGSSPGPFAAPPADARSASVCVCFLCPAVIAEGREPLERASILSTCHCVFTSTWATGLS